MKISVYYCFPRSGGTLLNQCLLCHPDNLVLSEVNPAGSVMAPLRQATEWFGLPLADASEEDNPSDYAEAVTQIHQTALETGRRLIIRDWTGANFLDGLSPWLGRASGQLEQRLYLERLGFTLRECAFVRRSHATYRSLVKHIPECAELSVEQFVDVYRAFLAQIQTMPRFTLENFTANPAKELAAICEKLDAAQPGPDFATNFAQVKEVNGNNTLARPPESASWQQIEKIASTPPAEAPAPFAELDELAGFTRS